MLVESKLCAEISQFFNWQKKGKSLNTIGPPGKQGEKLAIPDIIVPFTKATLVEHPMIRPLEALVIVQAEINSKKSVNSSIVLKNF